eukprot:6175655-Pleurochrysis_carterae.AAC.2
MSIAHVGGSGSLKLLFGLSSTRVSLEHRAHGVNERRVVIPLPYCRTQHSRSGTFRVGRSWTDPWSIFRLVLPGPRVTATLAIAANFSNSKQDSYFPCMLLSLQRQRMQKHAGACRSTRRPLLVPQK